MSVGSIVAGGVTLIRRQPRVVAVWTAIYIVVTAVMMVAMRPFVADMAAFQAAVAARSAAGIDAPPPLPGDAIGMLVLVELAMLILGLVAFAAVVRAAARPGGDRFAFLRLGMDEVRLFGLGVLFVIAAIVAEVVAILAVMLVALLVRLVAGDGAAAVVAVAAMIAVFAAVLYLEVRISLVGVLTVLRRRIVIGEAWRATRGRFWTLFGVYVLLGIMFLVVGFVTVAIINPGLVLAYARFDQQAIAAAAAAQLTRQAAGWSAGMIVQLLLGSVVMVVLGVVAIGSVTTAAIVFAGVDEGPVDTAG